MRRASRVAWVFAMAGVVAAVAYFGRIWFRYGRVADWPADPLLDPFMPTFEVAERHEVEVAAPADITFDAAMALDLGRSRVVRAIFKGREWLMGAHPSATPMQPRRFIDDVRSIGWGVLADSPGRALVMGAVTQPWLADVTFRSLPPDSFAAFAEPGFTKIVWAFVVEPHGPDNSVLRTETRVVTTDAEARRRFRPYWTAFSSGIVLIRRRALALIRADAERRHAASASLRPSAL